MKRRDLMRLAPVALAAGVVPAVAAVTEETPLMRMFREWEALMRTENNAHDMDDEAFDTLVSKRCDYETTMMQVPCQTATDWIIKVAVWTAYGGFNIQDCVENSQIWAEARTPIGGAA